MGQQLRLETPDAVIRLRIRGSGGIDVHTEWSSRKDDLTGMHYVTLVRPGGSSWAACVELTGMFHAIQQWHNEWVRDAED